MNNCKNPELGKQALSQSIWCHEKPSAERICRVPQKKMDSTNKGWEKKNLKLCIGNNHKSCKLLFSNRFNYIIHKSKRIRYKIELNQSDSNNETPNTQECSICTTSIAFGFENLIEVVSKHSKTSICDLIRKLLDQQFDRELKFMNDGRICTDCVKKINEYDLACITVEHIAKDLRDTILKSNLVNSNKKQTSILDMPVEKEVISEGNTSARGIQHHKRDYECQLCPKKFELGKDFQVMTTHLTFFVMQI